jgi:DNA end-binding protein Ku
MAARAIGSGTISFGLVNIPVKVFSANDSGGRISFNQLHKKCKGRLKQQLFCPTDNEVVAREDIIKGYEFAKDQYVVLSEEELDSLEEESSKAMEIAEFVPLESVDPLFFETGYYLGPDKGAERAYKLLSVALRESKHAAVAKYASRGKQNLVLMRPLGDGLVMQQLRYEDEVKALSEIPLGDAEVKEPELNLAKQFIQQLSVEKFDPSKYSDEYKKRVQDVIDRKVKGETVTFAPAQKAPPQVVDLMEALKASLAKSNSAPVAAEALAPVAKLKPVAVVPDPPAEERKGPKRSPNRAGEAAEKKAKGTKR